MLNDLAQIHPGLWRAATDPGYRAFVGAFGGWTAAGCMQAATLLVDSMSPQNTPQPQQPLALTINFTGPVREDFVVFQPSVVASSKSTTHVAISAFSETDDGERLPAPVATASVVFAKRRVTDRIDAVAMPAVPPPESIPRLNFEFDVVSWPAQYELHLAHGVPFKPNAQMRTLIWSRDADRAPLTFARLTCMADASFPRIFFHYPTLSPISTMTMTVQFHCDAAELEAIDNDFVLIEASSNAARHGFFDQHLRMFSRNGQLIATSTQLVWFDVNAGVSNAAAATTAVAAT
jgi:acyl-CoA thioesterase